MNIYNQLVELLGSREDAVEAMNNNDIDFFIDSDNGEFRFIREDGIDKVQQSELGDDLYILGCFTPNFLAELLGIDEDVIQSMQDSEAFEALGKLIIRLGKLEQLQEDYASVDGYGHHFAHYDHEEHEIGSYLVFRTN